MDTIKPLTDGEFNVSLKDDVQPVEFTGSEEIEVFSTWVKAKYTRVAFKATKAMDSEIKRLSFYQHIDLSTTGVGGRDLSVRNDVDDEMLDILYHNEVISRPLYEYCLRNQVDEIIFLA
jgi:hypothetical protein